MKPVDAEQLAILWNRILTRFRRGTLEACHQVPPRTTVDRVPDAVPPAVDCVGPSAAVNDVGSLPANQVVGYTVADEVIWTVGPYHRLD